VKIKKTILSLILLSRSVEIPGLLSLCPRTLRGFIDH